MSKVALTLSKGKNRLVSSELNRSAHFSVGMQVDDMYIFMKYSVRVVLSLRKRVNSSSATPSRYD